MLLDRHIRAAGRAVMLHMTLGLPAQGRGPRTDLSRPGTTVIAVDLELTGPGAGLGTVYHDALRLRVAQVNQRRLLGGRRLALQVVDNGSDPVASAHNIRRLAAEPDVTAIVTGGSGVATAADAIDVLRMPTIELSTMDAKAGPVPGRYRFRLAPGVADTAGVLAAELTRTRTATVGLVTVDDGYGAGGRRELTKAAAAFGLRVVLHEQVARGADDQQVAIVAARMAGWRPDAPVGPEAVVLWTYPDEAVRLAVALRQAGFPGRLFLGAAAAGSPLLAGEAGQALAGARMVFTDTLVADTLPTLTPATAARQAWLRAYVDRYGRYHAWASLAADAIDLVAAAIAGAAVRDAEESGSPTREAVRGAIEATRLTGLTGPIQFSAVNHSGLDPRSLRVLVATGERWYAA